MKLILVVLSLVFVALTGCKGSADYHDGIGSEWIEEQVANGILTRAEADILLNQEKGVQSEAL